MEDKPEPSAAGAGDKFQELWQIVRKLRSPEGCPWDREQNFSSMKNQFLDEVYEFIDALEEDDNPAMSEELGDLFFHLLFFSCLAEDEERFLLEVTLEQIKAKLIRRHPHVFSKPESDLSSSQIKVNWERIKREVEGKEYASALDSLPASLPPLLKAFMLGQKAAKVGFDWSSAVEIMPKLYEELAEVEEVLEIGGERLEEELGDLLFVVINLVRLSGFEPGRVLNRANLKFSERFRFMEQEAISQGLSLDELNLEDQEILWQKSKLAQGL